TELYDNLNRFVDFIHPEDRDRIQWGWQKSAQAAFSQEYRIVRPDGTLVWIRDRGFPIYDDQGEVLWIGGIAEDISERKQVEEILQQRETELRLVTNAVPSLISFIDADQCYRFNNHTYEDWFGQPAAATYGQHLREVLGEAAYEAIRPYVEQVLAGQQVTYESEVHYKEGGTRYINATYVPRFNKQGIVEGFVALINDVSERKQAEIALRESKERTQLAIQSARLGTWRYHLSTNLVEFDERMREIWGEPPDRMTIPLSDVIERVHPDDQAHVTHAVGAALDPNGSGTYKVDYRILWNDGRERWVSANGQVQFEGEEESRRVVDFIGTALDITERKQAEIVLREREQRLDLATRAAKLGVFEWNVQTDSAIWENAQMYDIFGHSQDDDTLNKAQSMNDVIHPDDRDEFERCLAEGMKTGYFHAACRIRRLDDGQWRWVESIGQFELAADGTPLRLIGVLNDISKRKYSEAERERLLASERTARAQAEAANRVKDEFLAVVSHELRSPLNPILGWSQLLLKGQLDEQKTQRALEIIKRNAQMQAQLINDLLDVSRILRGKLSLNQQTVNLQVVVQAALETVRLAAEAKSIQIHTQLESDIGSVAGDADRLQQVVWNLLSNAVKFTPEGGQVEVRLERKNVGVMEGENVKTLEGGNVRALEGERMDARPQPATPFPRPHPYAQLTITDTGKGIHPNFLPHVFDRFRQESTTTTRQFGGLGLGLALVQYLVELHGGSVEADSPGEGQGATFTIKLPLMSQTSAMNQEVQLAKAVDDLKGVNILVVDDDDSTREFLACLLELNGARVIAAASAEEALSMLGQFTPDILLSDIGMPTVDGYTLMRQVRRLPPKQGGQIPAIALTAYAGEINYQQAMAAGFQNHIAKPVEPDHLIDAIVALLKPDRQ
ncbi:MAG: PAS domain-containing protein, partial [Leptolyngbyaceae bacterium]|nr:PAS domain-containing protein [Leptolyngbyaceae bacterium]